MRHDNEYDTTPTGPVRILMADDDRNEHLLMTMAADACRVPPSLHVATDGNSLLSLLHQGLPHAPDMLFVDLELPGLAAPSLLINLGLHPQLRKIPVVVLTDEPTARAASACYALGAFHVEARPSRFGQMVDFLDRLLDPAATLPIRPFDRASLDEPGHPRFNDLAGFD